MTEHEANNALVWVSDKLWQSLTAEQKKWVHDGGATKSAQGAEARRSSWRSTAAAKLKKMGVKIVEDVDKASFRRSPIPISTSSPRSSARTPTRSRR